MGGFGAQKSTESTVAGSTIVRSIRGFEGLGSGVDCFWGSVVSGTGWWISASMEIGALMGSTVNIRRGVNAKTSLNTTVK